MLSNDYCLPIKQKRTKNAQSITKVGVFIFTDSPFLKLTLLRKIGNFLELTHFVISDSN